MRAPDRWWLQAAVAAAGVLVLVGLYVLLLRIFIDVTRVGHSVERRDQVYLAIHGGLVVGAAVVGFVLGKWLNGLGIAYAVLFLAAIVVSMVAVQLGTHALACSGGQNDLLRHWNC